MHLRIGYLASGSASSAQGIHEAALAGVVDVASAVVVANNSKSGALEWAESVGVPGFHLSGSTHPSPGELDSGICQVLLDHRTDIVILSGYAKRVGPRTIAAFAGRMLNVHPAPLPRFGGHGMFGLGVHQAVIDSGISESAVTIHHVTTDYDDGRIVSAFPVPVEPDDTATSLRARVHAAEPACWIGLLKAATSGKSIPGLTL